MTYEGEALAYDQGEGGERVAIPVTLCSSPHFYVRSSSTPGLHPSLPCLTLCALQTHIASIWSSGRTTAGACHSCSTTQLR